MPTKWEVYELLDEEFRNAMPSKTEELDIDVWEAHADRFGKEWNKFHEVEHEEFLLNTEEVK